MTQNYSEQFKQLLIAEVKNRLFNENVPRLKKCLSQLTEAEIWHRPNTHLNTVGNLVLHLCGNVRQWLISGLSDVEDRRERQKEFDEMGPISTTELIAQVDAVMAEVAEVLDSLSPEDLLKERKIQGIFQETGISILMHVVEHFSYHVGQITYIVKLTKDMDMGYYDNLNLEG